MKRIIKHYIVNTFALYIASSLTEGLIFEKGIQTLLLTGIGLTLASMFAKPIINLLLLPINLISFGLFSWVSSAIALYLVTLVIKEFRIESFIYSGLNTDWFTIPSISLYGALAYVAFSFIISIIASFTYWLMK